MDISKTFKSTVQQLERRSTTWMRHVLLEKFKKERLGNPLALEVALDGQLLYQVRILHLRMMFTLAKPVKATTDNFLKTSKLGETLNHLVPEHQAKTRRITTTGKHSEYWRTLAGKQMTDDTKQDFSGSQLKNCQTIAFTPKAI